MWDSEGGFSFCIRSDTIFAMPLPTLCISHRTPQIVSCAGGELYFLSFLCCSKMGQQMLEREKERERRRRRKKNSQSKLFALQCGLRREIQREGVGESERKRLCIYVLLSHWWEISAFLEQKPHSVLCHPWPSETMHLYCHRLRSFCNVIPTSYAKRSCFQTIFQNVTLLNCI